MLLVTTHFHSCRTLSALIYVPKRLLATSSGSLAAANLLVCWLVWRFLDIYFTFFKKYDKRCIVQSKDVTNALYLKVSISCLKDKRFPLKRRNKKDSKLPVVMIFHLSGTLISAHRWEHLLFCTSQFHGWMAYKNSDKIKSLHCSSCSFSFNESKSKFSMSLVSLFTKVFWKHKTFSNKPVYGNNHDILKVSISVLLQTCCPERGIFNFNVKYLSSHWLQRDQHLKVQNLMYFKTA